METDKIVDDESQVICEIPLCIFEQNYFPIAQRKKNSIDPP